MLAACAAIFVTMGLVYAFASLKVAGIDKELRIVGQQDVVALRRLEQLQPVMQSVSGQQSWSQRLEDATRILEEKQLVLSLVEGSALGSTDGYSRHLRSLARQDTENVWLTRIVLSATGDRNQLQGKALRAEYVAAYLQRLTGELPFSKQRFHQFRIEGPADGSDVVTFFMNGGTELTADLAEVR
jgi:hypothetical protein